MDSFFWSRPGRADPGEDFKIVTAPTRRYYSRTARFFSRGPLKSRPPLSRAKTRILYAPPRAGRVQLDGPRVTSARASCPGERFSPFGSFGRVPVPRDREVGRRNIGRRPSTYRESARVSRNRTTRKREAMNKYARKHAHNTTEKEKSTCNAVAVAALSSVVESLGWAGRSCKAQQGPRWTWTRN